MWRPAATCESCSYPNDDCFRFCQQCGVKRVRHDFNQNMCPYDVNAIDNRIHELDKTRLSKAYEKQKSKLEEELRSFLSFLPFPKTLQSAHPVDVVRFLVWKDNKGRTQVHSDRCIFTGKSGKQQCNCPLRLAAGTVDSVVGKLRAIFSAHGRKGAWDSFTLRGNPAIHDSVKSYIKSIQQEQAESRVAQKQATPMFLQKFRSLVEYLRKSLQDPKVPPTRQYILARDLSFFTLLFSSGARAGDLGKVKIVDILSAPNSQNLVIHQRVGKTVRGKTSKVVPIRPCIDATICPVQNLRFYIWYCREAGIKLRDGYVFRATTHNNMVSDAPFLSSAANIRLINYLRMLGIYEGETAHSFRSGAAILLRLLGASKEEVARHIGWQSTQMVDLYTQTEKVMSTCSTSPTPPNNPLNLDDGALVERVSNEFRERNLLFGFSPAFV